MMGTGHSLSLLLDFHVVIGICFAEGRGQKTLLTPRASVFSSAFLPTYSIGLIHELLLSRVTIHAVSEVLLRAVMDT